MNGNLDIIIAQREDEWGGDKEVWNEVLIHGDPEGLRSFANLLLKIADMDQESMGDLPVGAREHKHLMPAIDLSQSSAPVIVGRLDAKGTGMFYDKFIPRVDE